jgi:hypothetical protein
MAAPEIKTGPNPYELDLVELRSADQVEAGDTIYEHVRFGEGPHCIKYNPCRVIKTNKNGVMVFHENRGERITQPFKHFVVERKAMPTKPAKPKLVEAPPEPPVPASIANAFNDLLAMANLLFEEITNETHDLDGQRAHLESDLEQTTLRNRAEIQALEDQLTEARRKFERERAAIQVQIDGFDERVKALEARRTAAQNIFDGAKAQRKLFAGTGE